MTEDEYLELNVKTNRGLIIGYILLGILLAGYFAFIGVLVWQIDSNTHELLKEFNSEP